MYYLSLSIYIYVYIKRKIHHMYYNVYCIYYTLYNLYYNLYLLNYIMYIIWYTMLSTNYYAILWYINSIVYIIYCTNGRYDRPSRNCHGPRVPWPLPLGRTRDVATPTGAVTMVMLHPWRARMAMVTAPVGVTTLRGRPGGRGHGTRGLWQFLLARS